MYKIIGADGREYGPVTADQVRQWIAEGRANAQTQAQAEGSTDRKPLSAFPEFADALAGLQQPTGVGLPPRTGTVDPDALAAEIIARGYRIDIGSCLTRSWELLKSRFWLMVGATALILLVHVAMNIIPFVGGVIGAVLGGVLTGGLYWFLVKLIRGQPAVVGDAFAGFSLAFVQLMLAGLVSSLLTVVGLLFCLLPGIYLAVAWIMVPALVIDKKLDFWPAMELSRKVITKNWWSMFGLLIVNFLISVAGFLACGIGVFVAAPLVTGALMYAYEDIFGERAAQTT